jgi:hypothetical protein
MESLVFIVASGSLLVGLLCIVVCISECTIPLSLWF